MPTQIYFSEVDFKSIVDEEANLFFNNLPTSLELDSDDIDRLIASARILLRREPEFMRFVADNEGTLVDEAVSLEYLCQHLNHSDCRQ